MNAYVINFLLSISISLAAITGAIKWRVIDADNRPIIAAWWVVVCTEVLRFITIYYKLYSFTIYNLYILPLLFFLLLQFFRWHVISRSAMFIIMGTILCIWVADMFFIDGYQLPNRRFIHRICLNLTIVILAVTSINKQIMSVRQSLLTNHRFLICVGLTIYYTYRVLVDAFSLRGFSNEFVTNLSSFNRYLLQFYYLILFLAALWIPRKKNFILPS